MWYLNYCSPFLYNAGGSPQFIRAVLYSTLAFQLLVYLFFIAKYKIAGGTDKQKQIKQQYTHKQIKVERNSKIYTLRRSLNHIKECGNVSIDWTRRNSKSGTCIILDQMRSLQEDVLCTLPTRLPSYLLCCRLSAL